MTPGRRSILRLGAGSLAASLFAEAGAPTRVIDAAVHFYDPSRPQGVPWPGKGNPLLYRPTYPDRYLNAVRPCPVTGVIAIEASPWLEDNLWLLNVADRSPLVRAVIGHLQPGAAEFTALERFSSHPLFRGIRINASNLSRSLAQPAFLADLRRLASKDLHLDILVTDPASWQDIAALAAEVPDLRIVAGHLPLDGPRNAPGLLACAKRSQVFAKVSGVLRKNAGQVVTQASFYKPQLDEIWEVFGPDRVIYGSNWPASDAVAPYPVVYQVILDYVSRKSFDDMEKFFWKNSQTAYKWREHA